MNRVLSVLAGLVLSAVASVASAQFITGVSVIDVSSELGAPIFDRRAEYLVSSAGLDVGTGTHSINPDGTMWLSHGVFRDPFDPLPAHVVFDLGGVYDLETVAVWNYNEATAGLMTRGANLVNISVGTDLGSLVSLGDFTFTQAPGTADVNFRQDITLGHLPNTSTVRYVAFDILSNHGDTLDFAGLSKVRFSETSIGIPGDVNGDMIVDEADFQVINSNMFQSVTGGIAAGDLNLDNIVDFYDYKIWKNLVEPPLPSSISSTGVIPEPGSLLLVLGAIGVALFSRCRVSSRQHVSGAVLAR